MAAESGAGGIRIGIDLGGTKIEGLALAPDGAQIARKRIPAPRGDYVATLTEVAALATWLATQGSPGLAPGRASLGLAMPGSVSPRSGLVQNANSTWLNGRAIARDLAALVPMPLRIANDANCFALSEAVDGAGAGKRTVFGVILGTGVGGGIVRDGVLVDGPRGTGGEWGHNPIAGLGDEPSMPNCWCGRQGCAETWLSGPALSADHARVARETLTAEEIAERARHGDAACLASLERYTLRLGRGLAQVCNILDPDVVVLGGGLSNLHHLYEHLPRHIEPFLFTDSPAIDIRPPRWGDASGVRGAAWLWNDHGSGVQSN
ncbi:MAG: ROK family protein [Hyphomicrobiaceae bacterium]|nr:ROK family protein [Hyphomicrobiaceae bacterium]